MDISWENGFSINVIIDNGTTIISANKEGLLSLAKQLTALAGKTPGSHIHCDQYILLEEGSAERIIKKGRWRNEVRMQNHSH